MENFTRYINRNGMEEKAYQMEGVKWCVDIEMNGKQMGENRVHSGILADEMGLGKTAQMIGVILSRIVRRTLIVLPRALLEQWVTTIHKTLGHDVLVYHNKSVSDEELRKSPLVITTYGKLSQRKRKPNKGEKEELTALHKLRWDRVIFDEGHHLRNRNTRIHKAALALSSQCKWIVTGTPIQNHMTDFYGLCAILGIEQSFYIHKENIPIISRELILKRTKASVGIQLPPLCRHVIEVEWESEEERQLAEDIHAHLMFSRVESRMENPFRTSCLHNFAILQQAKQSCIDMGMLENTIKSYIELGIIKDDTSFLTNIMKYHSKTNKVIQTILERKDNGRSKLIFCHYHKEIDSVIKRLTDEGMKVARFDGRTSQNKRDDILSDTTLDVLVLQIKTGCEGLNLQQFSEIYFISPNWNPAVEDQAVARCHRIGQQSCTDVFSFKMVSFDDERFTRTMDMYTRELQHLKRIKMKTIEEQDNNLGEKLEEPCAICLDDQYTNTTYRLDCGHHFHPTCVTAWFKRNATCPICRRN